jgi:hypothetical protein
MEVMEEDHPKHGHPSEALDLLYVPDLRLDALLGVFIGKDHSRRDVP